MTITFITTVYNEEDSIFEFLNSLNSQSKQPDEIVIVDGGSTDSTPSKLYQFNFLLEKKNIKILVKKGNRSVGRNEAIAHATGDIIVCSDAGNILDKDWIKYITKPFINMNIDVVAGYYKGRAETILQKCIIPYVLVMPDKLNPAVFLPATRSIAFKKRIWQKVGKFNENLSHNEDYAFAHALLKAHANIAFAKNAIVYWIPRTRIKDAYVMFLRFAYGDAEAGIIRFKVLLIYARYCLWFIAILIAMITRSFEIYLAIIVSFIFYCIWAITKNYKYVRHIKAFYLLPLLQIVSDYAVLLGTIQGVNKVWDTKKQ